jgi:hypothetical protein
MKKIILLIILFLGAKSFAQTKGITYQALILNPSGEQVPGKDNTNAPLVDENVCMQFQFTDEFSKLEYQETIKTKTDQFGMVNLVIGSGNQTGGYAASFESMEWNALKKSLIVGINTDGSCTSFTEISDQAFTAVPFAFSAINAGNVTGVVAIENGGTNAVTIIGAKTNLGLEKVDNTSDLDKPMSIAAQAGWNINASGISEEAVTARAAESVLTNNLATEATTARAAEVANTTAISDEATRATDAEAVLATAISDETTRAGLAEVADTAALTEEAVTARAAELANSASILAETSARTTSDGLQNTAISDNASSITAETSARTTADGIQNTAITDEAARAGLAEVANATAIGSKEDIINKSIDGTFASNSDVLFPTEKATKTYVDAQVTTVRELADEYTNTTGVGAEVLVVDKTTFTLTQAPSGNSKVKMFINGIRISNTAYTISTTTLTYIPANNANKAMAANDRVQFDYYY